MMAERARATAYLSEILTLDPLEDARAIATRRAAFHASAQEAGESGACVERERVQEDLAALREAFWSLNPGACIVRIDSIRARAFPELESQVERLRAVAMARDEFDRAEESARVDGVLLAILRATTIAAPGDAAEIWLAEVEAFRVAGPDASQDAPARLRVARNTARELAKRYPAVHALERSWLLEVAGMHRVPRKSGAPNAWLWMWLLVATAGVVHGILGGGAP
jgi:hypothetical protein